MIYELLPIRVSRIAFVDILHDNLRVAFPTLKMIYELLPLPVSRIAFEDILHDNLRVASPT